MEGPLKERLTGALIVVAVLVIVVPEMLSGPDKPPASARSGGEAGPPVRTYSLELGTPAAPRTQDQSALTPQSAEPPAPAHQVEPSQASPSQASPPHASPPQASPPQVSPAKVPPAAAPAKASPPAASPPEARTAPPAADVKPAPAPVASVKNGWWTQLGSFSSRDNAERLARELRDKGYSIDIARIKVGNKELYRVRAGPVASREAAVALQSRLQAAGHKSSLVPP